VTRTFLRVGEQAEFSKTIGERDIALYAEISGDFDPVHMDEAHARATIFGRRIAHGGLVMGLLSTTAAVMSRRSLERGAGKRPVSLGYDRVRFLKPVFIGDTLTARYALTEVDDEKGETRAAVEVVRQDGEVCLAGTHVMRWV
jgi:acyl dehydratase